MNATDSKTVPTTPVSLTKTTRRRQFITGATVGEKLSSDVLAADGRHANPDVLAGYLADADTRTGSSGLVYVADHTDASALNAQAGDRIGQALANTAAYMTEHGATPEQTAAMAEISRILTESDDPAALAGRLLARIAAEKSHAACTVHTWCREVGEHEWHESLMVQVAQECDHCAADWQKHSDRPYIDVKLCSEDDRETGELGAGAAVSFGECEMDADGLRREVAKMLAAAPRLLALADTLDGIAPCEVPTDCDVAARVQASDAKGALLNAYLFTSMCEGEPDGPTVLSVYGEPQGDDDLDHAGAVDFLAQLDAFRSKVSTMVDVLAANAQAGGTR